MTFFRPVSSSQRSVHAFAASGSGLHISGTEVFGAGPGSGTRPGAWRSTGPGHEKSGPNIGTEHRDRTRSFHRDLMGSHGRWNLGFSMDFPGILWSLGWVEPRISLGFSNNLPKSHRFFMETAEFMGTWLDLGWPREWRLWHLPILRIETDQIWHRKWPNYMVKIIKPY